MTGPTPEQLHHLADRARRGVALPAEHDQLAAGINAMAERADRAEAANARARQLHRDAYPNTPDTGRSCTAGCGTWPCPTARALDEQQPTTTEASHVA